MFSASCCKYTLRFLKPARTSRNELQTHDVYYIRLKRIGDGKTTYGEAAPLKGLSPDDVPGFMQKIQQCCDAITTGSTLQELELDGFPSIRFALETAFAGMQHAQDFKLFDTEFFTGKPIAINGLVWMNDRETMLKEALDKAAQGFDTIKFKVGALDFDEECRMLESFRAQYNAHHVELRLDANGAFKHDEALKQLKELSRFDIHSIEQPIKAGQWEMMQEVCAESAIPVALDEELIGIDPWAQGKRLLTTINPAFLILKPTLIGGFSRSDEWVKQAEKHNTAWWATSALESNIGLNAIAQWVSQYKNKLPQGLGTGSLYHNNIRCPLMAEAGNVKYLALKWDEHALNELFN